MRVITFMTSILFNVFLRRFQDHYDTASRFSIEAGRVSRVWFHILTGLGDDRVGQINSSQIVFLKAGMERVTVTAFELRTEDGRFPV